MSCKCGRLEKCPQTISINRLGRTRINNFLQCINVQDQIKELYKIFKKI